MSIKNKLIDWTRQVHHDKNHTLNQNEPSCITIKKDGYLHKLIKNQILKQLELDQNSFFNANRFPLYQPKTFNHLSISGVNHHNCIDWFLSLKSDGCRYMLTTYQLDDRFANNALIHLMIDRSFNMFIIHVDEKTTNQISYIVDCEFVVRDNFSEWDINDVDKSKMMNDEKQKIDLNRHFLNESKQKKYSLTTTDCMENNEYTMIHFFDMWYYKDNLLKRNVDRFSSLCEWYCETIEETEYVVDLDQMYSNFIKLNKEKQKRELYTILRNSHANKFFSCVWDQWKSFETVLIKRTKSSFIQKYGLNTFVNDTSNENSKKIQFIPSCIKPFVPAFCVKEANDYSLKHLNHNDGLIFCDAFHIYKYKTNYTVDFMLNMVHPITLEINKMNREKQIVFEKENTLKRKVVDLELSNSFDYDYCFLDESKQFFYYCEFVFDVLDFQFQDNILKNNGLSSNDHVIECSLFPKKKQKIVRPDSIPFELQDGVWNIEIVYCLIKIQIEKERVDKNYCNNEKTLQQSIHLQMNPINVENLFY